MTKHEMNKRNRFIPGSIERYVRNKEVRQQSTFTIEPDGTTYWTVNGIKVAENEFNAAYPINGLISRSKDGQLLDPRQTLAYL